MTRDDFYDMSFHEYWTTYLRDLIEPLPDADRQLISGVLANGFLDGAFPGRESVQRLIESHLGVISGEQYRSWALSNAVGDGSAHILTRLRGGFCVDGSRERMIEYLANVEYSEPFAESIRQAHADKLLTADEVEHILATSLRNPPLPPLVERPVHVPALPFDRTHVERELYQRAPVAPHEETSANNA